MCDFEQINVCLEFCSDVFIVISERIQHIDIVQLYWLGAFIVCLLIVIRIYWARRGSNY